VSVVLILLTQAALSRVQLAAVEEDRKAFEPYRQCVLTQTHARYSSGQDFSEIFTSAQNNCAIVQINVAMDFAANALDRSVKAIEEGTSIDETRYGFNPMDKFLSDLIFELAKDFVPRQGINAPNP
jgi:hypothetical protein